MPAAGKNGWPYADIYVGEGWSVAYRTFDAQFWGVPQRRRRIYLVADFRGERAGKILFEREGLRRHTEKSREARQGTPADAEESTGAADTETAGGLTPYLLKIRQGVEVDSSGNKAGKGPLISENLSMTLGTSQDQYLFQPLNDNPSPILNQSNSMGLESTDGHIHSPILDDQGGQQISVRTDGKSPTLRAETHGNLPCVVESYGVTTKGNGDAFINPETHTALTSGGGQAGQGYPCVMQHAGTSGNNVPTVVYGANCFTGDGRDNGDMTATIVGDHENRITDMTNVICMTTDQKIINLNKGDVQSKTVLDPEGIAPSIYAGECRGGGGEMYVLDKKEPVVFDGANVTSPVNASSPKPGDPCHTLSTDSRNILVEPVICLQGNGIDRADTAGCNGKGWKEDISYTLNTIDRPAVCYEEKVNEHALCTDVGFFNTTEDVSTSLLARMYKDPPLVTTQETETQYIVRRLTPTECCRLQGFPDGWGEIDLKEDFTDEEYKFWHEVRNTHAAINDRKQQAYNKQQMLTWYNKLHTDSSEYKMWGNGIALPTALYVMEGIAEALKEQEGDHEEDVREGTGEGDEKREIS